MTLADAGEAATSVDVWSFDLDAARPHAAQWRWVLDADEQDRSDRLRTERLRTDYTATHVAVRRVLATYLSCEPDALVFDRTCGRCGEAHGKPALKDAPFDLRFSFSRASPTAVLAIRRGADVGVDVELERPALPEGDVAKSVFPNPVSEWLSELPAARRSVVFYRLWARLEAFVKATGEGLLALEDVPWQQTDMGWDIRQGDLRVVDVDLGSASACALAGRFLPGRPPRVRRPDERFYRATVGAFGAAAETP